MMLTVAILINGQPLMARSARNIQSCNDGTCLYFLDDGSYVRHNPNAGAVALAIELLKTIKEKEDVESCK